MPRYLTLFILFACAPINAQVSLEIFESFKLQERRDVAYYIPEDYSKEKKYPIILVLDAEYLFDQVVAQAKFYSKFHNMPEAIVVGVYQSKNNTRLEDCSFEAHNGLPTQRGSLFFEFLGMELLPFLENKYSTAPFKMFVGYDITANFGNYYLFKDDSLFNAYINISPTLAPEMANRIPERLSVMKKKIFYQLVLEGEPQDHTQDVLALDRSLKALEVENLDYGFEKYPTADHISIATYGLGKAFDRIFNIFKPITPKEYREKILASDEPVFNYLADKQASITTVFGIKTTPSLNDIMAIYAGIKKKEDINSLKLLADLCKKEYPKTMLGFYFEGEYYERTSEPKKALRTFEKAFAADEIDFLTKDMAMDKIDALKADFRF